MPCERQSNDSSPCSVAIDVDYELWRLYGNLGWPARYLFDQRGLLLHYHYGEGAYDETEQAIQELLGVEGELDLGVTDGVTCYAVCFTPGLAP
jgi:hypothetical protein